MSDMNLIPQFNSFAENLEKERVARIANSVTRMSFGVSYFDDALCGIYANDVVLIGAKSGQGKTELATHIAFTNAARGFRVMYFALEAERCEIERRIKFKFVARNFYANQNRFKGITLRYADWYYAKYGDRLDLIEQASTMELENINGKFTTIYRESTFYTADDFARHFHALQDKADLFVVDHVHYFDSDEPNENKALKETMKRLRDCALLAGKAIVLVAHLRKTDKRYSSPVPELEDFHGSSDLGKIATKAIAIAPSPNIPPDGTKFPTLLKVLKSRVGSDCERYLAQSWFDVSSNSYSHSYELGSIKDGAFSAHEDKKLIPSWAKIPTTNEFGEMK